MATSSHLDPLHERTPTLTNYTASSTIANNLTQTTYDPHNSTSGAAQDKNAARRERYRARQSLLTLEQKEEINARRRAARQNKTIDERNAHQRATRSSMSSEKKQKIIASQKARRQSLSPEERQVVLAQRNANHAAKKNTPFAFKPMMFLILSGLLLCVP